VLLGARGTPCKVGAEPREQLVDGLPGELGLDKAVELIEARIAIDRGAVDGVLSGSEKPDENRIGHHVTSR